MGKKYPCIRSRKCAWKKNKQKSLTFTKCFSFQDLQKLILQHRDQILQQPKGSQARFLSSLPSSQGQHKYHFQKTFTVSQSGNCRIMTYCDLLSCLVVSQPSPQASFLPGEQFRTSAFMYIIGFHLFSPFFGKCRAHWWMNTVHSPPNPLSCLVSYLCRQFSVQQRCLYCLLTSFYKFVHQDGRNTEIHKKVREDKVRGNVGYWYSLRRTSVLNVPLKLQIHFQSGNIWKKYHPKG